MPTATVKILFVNPPKEGKRFGSIKTETHGYFGVKPPDLNQFSKGNTYEIEYSERGEYKDFVRVVSKPNGAARTGTGGSPDNSRMIFVTGVVGRAMGSGKYLPENILELAIAAAAAFDALAAGVRPKPATTVLNAQSQRREEYHDPRGDVPFNDDPGF